MSIAEQLQSVARHSPARPLWKEASGPTLLCALFAAVEGSFVALEFLSIALVYHFALLDAADSFAWPLYLIFAAVLGIAYAGFAASAAARFFKGERQRVTTIPATFFGWTAAFATMLMIAFLSGTVGDLSRVSLTSAYVLGIPAAIGLRSLLQSVLSRQISDGALRYQKIAVIGERTSVLAFLLSGDLWRHGQSIAGTLYLEDVTKDGQLAPHAIADFATKALKKGAQYIVITGDVARVPHMNLIVNELKRFSLNVVYALVADEQRLKVLDVVPIGTGTTLRVLRQPLSSISVFLKRSLDVLGASLGLILLAPVFAIIAIAIKFDSAGPVIFRQERRGFNGESFAILKFRTMRVLEPGTAMRQAARGDMRITRVGRFLRASSMDELPQLLNVFKGQMSLVGPRPHAVSHDDELARQLADYAHRQRIKPGITGWAQINGFRGETATLEQMQGRTLHDLHYIDNWSIFLDIWVLFMTVLSPATHRNAF